MIRLPRTRCNFVRTTAVSFSSFSINFRSVLRLCVLTGVVCISVVFGSIVSAKVFSQTTTEVWVQECTWHWDSDVLNRCGGWKQQDAAFDTIVSRFRQQGFEFTEEYLSSIDQYLLQNIPEQRAFVHGEVRRRSATDAPEDYVILWKQSSFDPWHVPFVEIARNYEEQPEHQVSLSVNNSGSVSEGDTLIITATLDRNNTSEAAILIPLQVRRSGTTAQSEDYTVAPSITISTNARTGTTNFAATDDDETEAAETVVVELGLLPAGVTEGASNHIVVSIADNDAPPKRVIGISTGSPTIDDGSVATFTLTAEPPPTTPLEIAVTVSQSGNFANSDDIGARTVTIGTDGEGRLTVRTRSHEADEGGGSITVTVNDGEGYSGGSSATVVVEQATGGQTNDVSYVWECENNDHTTFAYDVGLQCELSQSRRNTNVQEVVQSYLNDGYQLAPVRPDTPVREAEFNAHYNVEGCSFLYRELSGDFAYSDVVVCSVPLSAPTESSSPQQQAVEGTVAAVAAATVSNVTSNIGARFSAPNTGGASVSLAGMPVVFGKQGSHDSTWTSFADPFDAPEDSWQSQTRSLTGDELLGSSSFEIALGAAEGSNSPDSGRQVTVWGRGDFQVFESGGGRNSGYDGDLVAGYMGADFNTGGRWLVGMALSRIKAEADYTLADAEGSGKLEAELTNLHPYARFAVDDRSEVWTILGLGKGEVTDTAQGASESTSDLSMHMMSAGARHLLNSFIGLDWALLGDGSLARVETSEGVEAVDGISASVWRVRAGVEGSYTSVWEGGSSLTSFLEVAARQDGGASAEGRGLELSPGLAFSDSESGFSIEARGRALVLHSADNHREYGASLTVSKAPDANGTGLSLAMTPTWGAPTSSLDSIDASLFPQNADDGRTDSLSLNSRVAYGFAAGPGILSPFAEFSVNDGDSHRTRVGSRYSLSPSVDLELSGDRMSSGLGDSEHSVQFRARLGF